MILYLRKIFTNVLRYNFYIKLILSKRMSHSSISPKLLLQFYKDQQVPKLVKKKPELDRYINSHHAYKNHHSFRKHQTQKKSLTNSLLDGYFNKSTKKQANMNLHSNQKHQSQQPQIYQRENRSNSHQNHFSPQYRSHSPAPSPPLPRNRLITQQIRPHHHKIVTFEEKKYQQQQKILLYLKKDNQQLKILTNQLIQKQKQMKSINLQLHERIMQLERKNQQLIKQCEYEKSYQNHQKKIRSRVYQQIGYYLHDAVDSFAQKLTQQKMSPIVQSHIENFLQLVLNINDISVSQIPSRSSINPKINAENIDNTIQQIIRKSKQKRDAKSKTKVQPISPSPIQKYQSVFEKINNMHYNNSPQSQDRDIYTKSIYQNNKSHIYGRNNIHQYQQNGQNMRIRVSPSPSASRKRVRIFNRSYEGVGQYQQKFRQKSSNKNFRYPYSTTKNHTTYQ